MNKDFSHTKILALDTASLTGSVALCQGETLVAESLLNVRSTHSEKLLGQIDLLLGEAGWDLADLDLLAAVTGPGSFTGLRIGLATIKGLGQVLDKPVVPVSALQVAALGVPLAAVAVCAFLDARKKEVYTQLFDTLTGSPVAIDQPRVLPPRALLEKLPRRVVLVGDGVSLYHDLIIDCLGERALLPPAPAHQRHAFQAAWLALQAFEDGAVVSAAELLPTYIRPSDAELNLPAKPALVV